MLGGADLPSQHSGYFSRLLLAPLLASQGLGEARQSQHRWVAPSTAVGWWRAPMPGVCQGGSVTEQSPRACLAQQHDGEEAPQNQGH